MTSEEIRLAKLSKTLNNSNINYPSYSKVDEFAYKQTVSSLQRSLNEEKSRLKSEKLNYDLSINAKLNEEDIKQQVKKHHSQVLEAQIRENQLKKQLRTEYPEPTYASPEPETPSVKNYGLREELLKQIAEKQSARKKESESEVQRGKQLIENSNKLLDGEIEAKIRAKQRAYQDMVSSWEETLKVSRLQKELEKIRMYGPKAERLYTQPIIEEEYRRTETPLIQPPRSTTKKTKKSTDNSFDWKKNLRSSSVKSPSSVKTGQSFNAVIEKFGVLNSREKSLKRDKDKLLKYFEDKQSSRSKEFKLPKIT